LSNKNATSGLVAFKLCNHVSSLRNENILKTTAVTLPMLTLNESNPNEPRILTGLTKQTMM
jgi:hypothetical protein